MLDFPGLSYSCEYAVIVNVQTRSELDWLLYLKIGFVKVLTPRSIFRVNSSQAFQINHIFIASYMEQCQGVNKLYVYLCVFHSRSLV